MKKLPQELFNLSKEEEDLSRMMYNDKIIKCLVAPYHTPETVEIGWEKTIYLFPEKDISAQQCRSVISMIVANPQITEAKIITANIDIIRDMVDGCVRILTEDGRIIPSPEKTFMANQHTILYCLLQNEEHQIPKNQKNSGNEGHDSVQLLLDRLNDNTPITPKEFVEIEMKINLIGEDIIRGIMKNHLEFRKEQGK